MTENKLDSKSLTFALFVIYKLAASWKRTPADVYGILVDTKIFDEYIVGCYDCLHTLGGEYLTEDITEIARARGVNV